MCMVRQARVLPIRERLVVFAVWACRRGGTFNVSFGCTGGMMPVPGFGTARSEKDGFVPMSGSFEVSAVPFRLVLHGHRQNQSFP